MTSNAPNNDGPAFPASSTTAPTINVASVGTLHVTDPPAVKLGLLTTEFWLAFIVAAGGMLATAYSSQPWAQVAGIISAALASLGYGLSRSQVKSS